MRKYTANPEVSKAYYYMHGIHAVLSSLQNPKRVIQKILCTKEIFAAHKAIISNHSYEILNANTISSIIGHTKDHSRNHQGIAAYVQSVFRTQMKDVSMYNRIAILDHIKDPQNIGSIIRSAAAFNIDAIILSYDQAPNENATIAKAASGALELVQIFQVTNINNTINFLKKQDFWIIGLDSKTSNTVSQLIRTEKMALVLGSEDIGIRKLTKESCDYLVKIPISSNVESINVSSAAAIGFYFLSI